MVQHHYGIMAKESGLLPLKTDKSTKTQRTTSNGGLSLPCSSSALMNSHTKKLNNRRHIERHTKTGNHKKVSCFFAFIFGVFEKPPYCPTKRETWHALCLAVFNFRWCGEWKENEEISQNSRLSGLVWFCKEWGEISANQRPFCILLVCRYWREIFAGTQQTSRQ